MTTPKRLTPCRMCQRVVMKRRQLCRTCEAVIRDQAESELRHARQTAGRP